MIAVIIIVLVLIALAIGIWWYTNKKPVEWETLEKHRIDNPDGIIEHPDTALTIEIAKSSCESDPECKAYACHLDGLGAPVECTTNKSDIGKVDNVWVTYRKK